MLIGVSLVLGALCGAVGLLASFEWAILFVAHIAIVFGWFLLASFEGLIEALLPFVIFLAAMAATALGAGLRSFYGKAGLQARL